MVVFVVVEESDAVAVLFDFCFCSCSYLLFTVGKLLQRGWCSRKHLAHLSARPSKRHPKKRVNNSRHLLATLIDP